MKRLCSTAILIIVLFLIVDINADSKQNLSPYSNMIDVECTYYYPTGNLTYTETVPKHGRTIAMNKQFIKNLGYTHGDTVILYYDQTLVGYFEIEDKGGFKGNVVDVFVDDTTNWNETFYKDLKQQGRLDAEIQIVKAVG